MAVTVLAMLLTMREVSSLMFPPPSRVHNYPLMRRDLETLLLVTEAQGHSPSEGIQ